MARILGHRFADIARRFAARANLLRQRAIGGGAPPADPAQSVVNLGKERVLTSEIERHIRKVGLLASKVPFRSLDDRRDALRWRARLRAGSAAAHQPLGGLGGFCGQLKARDPCIAPGDCAEAHWGLKDTIVLRGFAHSIASRLLTRSRCVAALEIQPDSCYRIPSCAPKGETHPKASPQLPGRIMSASALRIAVLGTPNSPP